MSKPRSPRKPFGKALANTRQPALWGKDILVIERMSQEGRGVARRAGKVVFVNGALAGEQVRAQWPPQRVRRAPEPVRWGPGG